MPCGPIHPCETYQDPRRPLERAYTGYTMQGHLLRR